MANHKLIIPHILKWEGGISRAKTDTASSNTAPGTGGVHTNKGITWGTFQHLAPQVGVEATPNNFLTLPNNAWEKIFKKGYWDAIKGDLIQNQNIANFLVDIAWGSGSGVAVKALQRALNFIGFETAIDGKIGKQTIDNANKAEPGKLLDVLYENRKKQLVAYNQPANLKGWLNRLNSLYNFTKQK